MPVSPRVPSYRLHKPSGRAVVTIGGADVYLGTHGTKTSRDEYDRVIGEWMANGRRAPGESDLSVAELLLAFWKHAQAYYRAPDGKPTSQVEAFRPPLRILRRLYGRTLARDFGPLALKAVRLAMVGEGWCRSQVNRQTSRVRQVFKWGVAEEIVPPSVLEALRAVEGLRIGRTDAPESEPVRPVPEHYLAATLPHLSPTVRAMVEVQLVTGMRPGEMCAMRWADVDTGDGASLWHYKPATHKTAHHGHTREIYLGPRAQDLLRPFLKTDLSAHVFNPTAAEAERRAAASKARKTPKSCGNVPGSNRRRKPKRQPGDRYTVRSYRRAIARACERAFAMPAEILEPRNAKERAAAEAAGRMSTEAIAARRKARQAWRDEHVWHPHQLRHNAGTRLRAEYGVEAAQVILGHKTLSVTQVYAEKNVKAAQRIMAEVG
jgi:integrase